MKFSKIAAVMKKAKAAILVKAEDGTQWLSNGAAAYKLEGMPTLDEDTVLTVMNVADDAREKWYTLMREDTVGLFSNSVDDEEEITADDAGISVIHNGKLLTPIYTRDGMLWLDTALLEPIEKKEMDYRIFFIRRQGEHRAVAVKDGMILTAVIMESDEWEDNSLYEGLCTMLERCNAERKKRLEKVDERVGNSEEEGGTTE